MKVIQGKQAVLRAYLSEEQCVTPVQGRAAVPGKPIDYAMKRISVREAEISRLREHFVKTAETQTLTVSEQPVENAVVRELPAAPIRSAEAVMETGRIMDVTEERNLTIGQLFVQAIR